MLGSNMPGEFSIEMKIASGKVGLVIGKYLCFIFTMEKTSLSLISKI